MLRLVSFVHWFRCNLFENAMQGEGSSGDGQASNPFEYYTRKPMADDGMEHDMMSLIKDCAGRQQLKRVCHVPSGDLVRIRCTHCQRSQAVNEVMKSIARNIAEFVVLAADTEPIEIVLQASDACCSPCAPAARR